MKQRTETFEGTRGSIVVHVWEATAARRIVLIAHGYGEHSGRYGHVAAALVDRGDGEQHCDEAEEPLR